MHGWGSFEQFLVSAHVTIISILYIIFGHDPTLIVPVNFQTVLFRRTALDGLEHCFDENLHLSEEFDLFMRILYKSKAVYVHEPLAIYRIHPGMSSIKYIEKYPKENAYIIEKLIKNDVSISSRFENAIKYHRAKIAYWKQEH